jgi:MFS family permease
VKTRAEAAPLILSVGLAGLVVMADNWAASLVQAAVLITAYMLPFGLLQLLYSDLADRFGKLAVPRFAMIGSALRSPDYWVGSLVG